jgi:protein CSF1
MKADFRSGTSPNVRQWHVSAYVDGFVLDLDPEIVDNVFGLIDVYRKGRERIDRLTVIPQTSKSGPEVAAPSVEASYLAIRTSNVLITLVFHTGKLHLRGIQPDLCGTQVTPTLDAQPDTPNVIDFPTITVWGDYRATPAASKVSSLPGQEPSALIFGSQVYTTTNRIQPSIFLFLTDFAERIEDRLRLPDSEPSLSYPPLLSASEESGRASREFLAPGVFNGIQLSFSLRIDSSRLELECTHDLGVVAALHWESGGFLVTISPSARIARFAGSVTGLEVDLRHLKHQAGTVQTAKADARNLAFSVSYSLTDNIDSVPTHSVSVVVDTEFGAALRFDRLQDILIFKAIYIDRLPGTVPQSSSKSRPVSDKSTNNMLGLTTLFLIRARHVKICVDLGHNVAAVFVNLESLVLRSRIAGSVTDLSVFVVHTSVDLEEDRPLGGYLRLPHFSFATASRSDVQLGTKDGIAKMLDVTLGSGDLDIVLQSDKRTLLQYQYVFLTNLPLTLLMRLLCSAKPFKIRIVDDWSAIDWKLLPQERTLRLDFSVEGEDVIAIANLQSVPRIINLLSKLQSDLNAQELDARTALATSSISQLPKPESELSEVADAMIRSARSKFSEGPPFSYIIIQRMKLGLSSLRLALFKNPNDSEMALFQGRDVHAELERILHSPDMPPTRRLKLSFSSLYLSKYASLKYRSIGDELMAVPWLERLLQGASEWTIARVPTMNLEMNSDVKYEGRQEVLEYDLVATADDQAQSSSSIYVSLNLSLYIWAGALVKGLGLEIDKALVTSGFNTPTARAVAAAVASSPSQPSPATTHDEGKTKPPEATSTSPASPRSPMSVSSTTPVTIISHQSEGPLPRKYHARSETSIDYGTIEQLGEATPDAKAPWLGLKETVPPRVHEYATLPMEVLMRTLLGVYNRQLRRAAKKKSGDDSTHDASGIMCANNPDQER